MRLFYPDLRRVTCLAAGALAGQSFNYKMGSWDPPYGIELQVDALAALMLLIITGASAGAINAAHMGAGTEPFAERVEQLVGLWSRLEIDDVFRVDTGSILRHVWRWGMQLAFFMFDLAENIIKEIASENPNT